MKKNLRVVLVIPVLAMTALACEALSGGSEPVSENPPILISTLPANDEPDPIPTEPESQPQSSGNVILSDDFSSDRWGTGTDTDSAVEYMDNALNFDVYTDNYFVWSTPDNVLYSDVHMDVTVFNNDTDTTTAFGFICNKSEAADFYYFAMTPAGQYAIVKAETGQTDVFLTNNDEWAYSDLISVNADSYRVGADCGNGSLALYVDGQLVDSVNDISYTSGYVAVFAWSGEEVGIRTNLTFDDFVMTELP